MPTRMPILNLFVCLTRSHVANGLIHGVVANAIVIALMLFVDWLDRVSQIHYTLLPFATVMSVLCLGSVLGSGFVPTRLYVNRMIGDSIDGASYGGSTLYWQYLVGLIGMQYVGWGMVFLELTAQMNLRSAQINGAHYGGSAWGVFVIGFMPMLIPYAGALLSVPTKTKTAYA